MLRSLSRVRLFATPWTAAPQGSSVHGDCPCKNTGVRRHALLQGPSPGSNPSLLHWQAVPLSVSRLGSPFSVDKSGEQHFSHVVKVNH